MREMRGERTKEKEKQPGREGESKKERDVIWGARKRDGESSWSSVGSRRKERLRGTLGVARGEKGRELKRWKREGAESACSW